MITKLPSLPRLECPVALDPIPPLTPPAFPTFSELVEADTLQTQQKSKRLTDLFDGTLGDLTLLVSDYQEHPDKYEASVKDLLEQLMHGSKLLEHLSSSDRLLLNIATLCYHQAAPPPPARTANAPRRKLDKTSKARKNQKQQKPRPGTDVPVTELPAYWWLQ
jgi:hypothetical protein